MSFDANLVQQFQELSESDPFPAVLERIYDSLGFPSKYVALELIQSTFEENSDYVLLGGICYLTLTCLQELAMIARTPQGKAARRYFLECERIAKSVTGVNAVLAEELSPVIPTEAQLHAMRTRESEKLELAALPVSQKKIPKFRRAVDIARDRAAKAKEDAEVIDW